MRMGRGRLAGPAGQLQVPQLSACEIETQPRTIFHPILILTFKASLKSDFMCEWLHLSIFFLTLQN